MTERRVRDIIADAGDAGDAVQGFIEDMEPGDFWVKAIWGLGVMMAWYTDDGVKSAIIEPELACYLSTAFRVEAEMARGDRDGEA